MNNHLLLLLLFLLFFAKLYRPISALDFVFNGFNSSDILLYGNATVESRILTLTNASSFSIGRSLYETKIPTKTPNSSYVLPFSTSFIFSLAPTRGILPGHGLVFIFTPITGLEGTTSAQNLGLFNRTIDGSPNNHVLGVEFDVFSNQEFNDTNDNHVGIDVNSLKSVASHDAGYWPDSSKTGGGNGSDDKLFKKLKLNNGRNYQVWIDYSDSLINVTMAPVGVKRPIRPLLNISLNLSQVFEEKMYVGFTASTGSLVESHRVLAWSFSNSNLSLSAELITTGLPSFILPKIPIYKSKAFIAGIAVGSFCSVSFCVVFTVLLIKRRRRKVKERAEMEEWELEYWPHRMTFQEIEAATKNFSEVNVIGIGGNGKVYKGVLPGGAEIAVKRISHNNDEGMREFLAEVSSLGRLKHRSLVRLRGWCKREKRSLMLVYDCMENGSLDKRIFECDESNILSCEDRVRILKDVASAVLYLHEGWESIVLHRDIKSSNVLLDKEMNGKLGDFGLARMHGHNQVATTSRVVGTVGYLAPEVLRNGRASAQTDVFGFGVLILEVLCGRRPIEDGKPALIDSVCQFMMQGELIKALDPRLNTKGGFEEDEVQKLLQLGLLCAYPDPSGRPTMRQVVKILEWKTETWESESEDIDAYLQQRIKSREIWSDIPQSPSNGSHPTFQDIKQLLATSMLQSLSNSFLDGR